MRLGSLHCGTERIFMYWLHIRQEKEDSRRNSVATNWKEFITLSLEGLMSKLQREDKQSNLSLAWVSHFPWSFCVSEESERMWNYMLVPESGHSPYPKMNVHLLPKDSFPECGGRNNRDSYMPTRSPICRSNRTSLPSVSCKWFIYSFFPSLKNCVGI